MRNWLFILFLTFLTPTAAEASQPNILLIYVDDLGYGDTAVYGHPVVETPNIDQLAAEGVRFTQFYAPSALCSPSRAGVLTGRTPYRTGIESWIPDNSDVALNRDEVTLAAMLKDVGYRTAVIGKWHLNGGLGMTDVPQPSDFGFDYQYGLGAWVKNEKAEAAGDGKLFPDNMYRNNQPVGETSDFSAALVSDEAINWIGKLHTQPFFLFLTYSEVHTPVASPEPYIEQYQQFLTDEARQHPDLYYMNWSERPARGWGEYYANISYLDAQMGRVLQHLKESGLAENTLIIFSSDNGPVTRDARERWELNMAGETGGYRGKKRYLFEGGIRVPGIFTWPGNFPAGAVIDDAATALDVMPTLAEILDLQLPTDRIIDGRSITGLLDEDPETGLIRDEVFYWSLPTPDGMEYAVREGPWKMILDPDGEPAYLFNLDKDRFEVVNRLAAEPKIAKRLKSQFDRYRQEVEQTQ